MPQYDRLGNDMSDDVVDALAWDEEDADREVYSAESDMEYAYEERMSDGVGPYGDARRCPRHPQVKTSSDDGMFDGVCGICEDEMSITAFEWSFDSANPQRKMCQAFTLYIPQEPRYPTSCKDELVEDNIPF